jgi:hypothetical protein
MPAEFSRFSRGRPSRVITEENRAEVNFELVERLG